jgi:hypothetical protein
MSIMATDDAVIADFLKRLDSGQMDGRLNVELSKLSYAQILTVGRILAERRTDRDAERR